MSSFAFTCMIKIISSLSASALQCGNCFILYTTTGIPNSQYLVLLLRFSCYHIQKSFLFLSTFSSLFSLMTFTVNLYQTPQSCSMIHPSCSSALNTFHMLFLLLQLCLFLYFYLPYVCCSIHCVSQLNFLPIVDFNDGTYST